MRIYLTPVTVYATTLDDGRTVLLQQLDTWAGMTQLRRVDAPEQRLILDIEAPGFAGLFRSITDPPPEQEALVVKGSPALVAKLRAIDKAADTDETSELGRQLREAVARHEGGAS